MQARARVQLASRGKQNGSSSNPRTRGGLEDPEKNRGRRARGNSLLPGDVEVGHHKLHEKA